MKKCTLLPLCLVINITQAQWVDSHPAGDIYFNHGNVGIGTNSPAKSLTVAGSFRVGRDEHELYHLDIEPVAYQPGDVRYDFVLSDHGDIRNTTALSINGKNGNVGIGTNTPTRSLTVAGSFRVGRDEHELYHMDIEPVAYQSGDVRYDFVISDHGDIQNDKALSINGKNGWVGIGTVTPDAKLTVKGDIHAEEVRVDLNVPGPDYVFEEEYDLPSLESIQNYVRKNKHLPGVPTAEDMKEDGIDLGVMNMLLLKKVEELTLHLIEQNEEMKMMKELLKSQQYEIDLLKSGDQ